MTATLPQEVRDAFERFITCEYTTVDARQQPIVWPVTPFYSSGAPTLDTTTGLGYPKKANDARRNPHVAMLFSDPTGSGVQSGIQVLVQGMAEVDDRDLKANRERYEREAVVKLPRGRSVLAAAHRARHGRVVRQPHLHQGAPGAGLRVARRRHRAASPNVTMLIWKRSARDVAEEPLEPHEPPTGGTLAWDERVEQLGRSYPSAVLAWVGPDGFPLAVRLPVSVDAGARRISLGAEPAGLPLAEGRACLTAHGHDADFKWRENFQVRGDLVSAPGGWALVPHKLVGGLELPNQGILGRYRRTMGRSVGFYRTARRELRKRKARAVR